MFNVYIADIYKILYNKREVISMGEKYTEAQKNATMKYLQEKTDDIRLRLPKGTKDRWKAAADAAGYSSMTKFVQDVVEAVISTKDARG